MKKRWCLQEDDILQQSVAALGCKWLKVSEELAGRNDEQCRQRYILLQAKKNNPSLVPAKEVERRNRIKQLSQIYPISQRILDNKSLLSKDTFNSDIHLQTSVKRIIRLIIQDIVDNSDESDLFRKEDSQIPLRDMVNIASNHPDKNISRIMNALICSCHTTYKGVQSVYQQPICDKHPPGRYAIISARKDFISLKQGLNLTKNKYSSRVSANTINDALEFAIGNCFSNLSQTFRNVKIDDLVVIKNIPVYQRNLTLKECYSRYKSTVKPPILGEFNFKRLIKLCSNEAECSYACDYFIVNIKENIELFIKTMNSINCNDLAEISLDVLNFLLKDFCYHLNSVCHVDNWNGHCLRYSVGLPCKCLSSNYCYDCVVVRNIFFFLKKCVLERKNLICNNIMTDIISVLGFLHSRVLGLLGHFGRKRIQDHKINHIKGNLSDNQCLVIIDWAMKLEPKRTEESSTSFFAKKGISYLGVSLIYQDTTGLKTFFFDYFVKDQSGQEAETVIPILFILIKQISSCFPQIKELTIQSDNAVSFQNLALFGFIFSMNLLYPKIQIKTYLFSEAQTGKTVCDSHFAYTKIVLNNLIKFGHRATTACEVFESLKIKPVKNSFLSLVKNTSFEVSKKEEFKKKFVQVHTRNIAQVNFHNYGIEFLEHSNHSKGIDIYMDLEEIQTYFNNINFLPDQPEDSIIPQEFQGLKHKDRKELISPSELATFEIAPETNPIGLSVLMAGAINKSFNSVTARKGIQLNLQKRFQNIKNIQSFISSCQAVTSLNLPYHSRTSKHHPVPTILYDYFDVSIDISSNWAKKNFVQKRTLAIPDGVKNFTFKLHKLGDDTGHRTSVERATEILHLNYLDIYSKFAINEESIRNLFNGFSNQQRKKVKLQELNNAAIDIVNINKSSSYNIPYSSAGGNIAVDINTCVIAPPVVVPPLVVININNGAIAIDNNVVITSPVPDDNNNDVVTSCIVIPPVVIEVEEEIEEEEIEIYSKFREAKDVFMMNEILEVSNNLDDENDEENE